MPGEINFALGEGMECLEREDAALLRSAFASYFNGQGYVPWQWDHVRHINLLWIKKTFKTFFLNLKPFF